MFQLTCCFIGQNGDTRQLMCLSFTAYCIDFTTGRQCIELERRRADPCEVTPVLFMAVFKFGGNILKRKSKVAMNCYALHLLSH